MLWLIAWVGGVCVGGGAMALYLTRKRAPPPAEPAKTPEQSDDEKIAAVLDALPLPMWWRSGADLNAVSCNAACRRILFEADSERGVTLAGHVFFRDRTLARRARDTGREQTESRTLTVHGQRRLFDIAERQLEDDRTIGFAIDQTALVTLQEDLAKHVAANDAVLELMTAAIAIFGPDKRLRFHNDAFRLLWRLDSGNLEGEPMLGAVLDLLRDRRQLPEVVDFPAFRKGWNARFTNLIDPVEDLWFLPDERAVRLVANPHPLGGLIFTFEDVTDRLALERSYNTATAVQRATLNNLLEAVAVFGSDGRLKLHNRIYREVWGLDESALDGNPHIADLVDSTRGLHPDIADWVAYRAGMVRMVTNPRPTSGRMTIADGRILDYAFVPLPDGDCLSVHVDVTDSARLQRALEERNTALEKADLIKSRFISSMSYEFRTPLNAIIGFAELLQTRAFGPLNKRQDGYVADLLNASNQLAELIADVLDLAAIQAGTFAIEFAAVDLRALIDNLGSELKREWEGAVSFSFDSGSRAAIVSGDGERLQRAFYYIAANARKFSKHGGGIGLNVSVKKTAVFVEIEDTGSRLPTDDRDQILETLNRPSGHAGDGPIGLRLALSRSLLELHGGSISAQPSSDGGMRIVCRLPLTPQTQLTRPGEH